MLAIASREPEIVAEAKAAGTEGLTLAGICCTANEILIRHGIPVAGNFLQQELAIITGAVEMLITDVQCCMPSLPEVAQAYHTEVVSTSDIARTIGSAHMPFDEEHAMEAPALIRRHRVQEPQPAQVSSPRPRSRWSPASASPRSNTCSAAPTAPPSAR
jgi:carbon-monoxide dehydrogenase catalytic subunit